jgi:hypothetical protein
MNSLNTLAEVPAYALSRPNGHEIVSPSFTSWDCLSIVAYCSKCESEISAFYFDSSEDCGGYWSSFRPAFNLLNKKGACV